MKKKGLGEANMSWFSKALKKISKWVKIFFRNVLGTEINLYICSPFEKRETLGQSK